MRSSINITFIICFAALACFGQVATLQITPGTAGTGKLHATIATLSTRTPAYILGQSNGRGVDDITTLPVADRDSADVLRTYVWTFGGGGTLRKVFPRNVSPIRRTQDSILVGTVTSFQQYFPAINPKMFVAEWVRGGTGLVPYPSGAGSYFRATTANAYNMDDFVAATLALSGSDVRQACLIWTQGENEMEDADASLSANYASNWATFASDFRTLVGFNVPIFIIQMHSYTGATHYSTMIAQQATMAAQVGNAYVVSSSGLGASSVHYTYAEHLTLSSRLADSMASYYNRPKLIRL
jgi:hypothetical protein